MLSITDIIFDLAERMVSFAQVLREWMFSTITIGGMSVSVWGLLGGGAVLLVGALIVISIVNG